MKNAASLSTLVLLVACGRTDLTRTDGAASGSARGGTTGSGGIEATGGVIATGGTRSSSSACGGRTPLKHRPAGSICPRARGSGFGSPDPLCPLDGGSFDCLRDSDCTAGTNGRCFLGRRACMTSCEYDTCFNDSDCADNQPCNCRALPEDWSANSCVTGSNCRVDADCGACGYCSPSQVNVLCFCMTAALCPPSGGPGVCGDACGHAYFCHTAQDTCFDDSDCTSGGTCNYDWLVQAWSCEWCIVPP